MARMYFKSETLLLLTSLLATLMTVRLAHAQLDGKPMPARRAMQAEVKQLFDLTFQLERDERQGQQDRARNRFESALQSRLNTLDRRYGLSEAQRKKLLLAGRAEIQRHFERIDELDDKLHQVRLDPVEYAKVQREIQTLSLVEGQDLFQARSLFAKVLSKTLTKEQAARYHAIEGEIASKRHQATLKWVLDTWDQTLGLGAEQHRQLDVLFHHETRSPRRFGSEDYFGVLFQVSRIPEAKLKPIFRADQWATLINEFSLVRGKEQMLKREGYIPEDDVATAPSSVTAPDANTGKKQG